MTNYADRTRDPRDAAHEGNYSLIQVRIEEEFDKLWDELKSGAWYK